MKNRVLTLVDFPKEVVQNYGAHNGGVIAAGVAFFALLSLFPTILLLLAFIGFQVAEPETSQRQVVNFILNLLPSGDSRNTFKTLIEDLVKNALNPRRAVSGIGLVLLAYSVSRVFGGLQAAMNVVFGVTEQRNFIMGKVVPFLAVFGMLLSVFASIAASTVIGIIRRNPTVADLPGSGVAFGVTSWGVSLAILAVVFSLMYYFLPAVHVAWRHVFLGGFVAALLWSIVKEIAAQAPRLVGLDATYGTIGALIAFLTWIYLTLQILIIGAEVAAERARRRGNEDVRLGARAEATAAEEAREAAGHPAPAVAGRALVSSGQAQVAAGGASAASNGGELSERTDRTRTYVGGSPVGARNLLLILGAAVAALFTGRYVRPSDDR